MTDKKLLKLAATAAGYKIHAEKGWLPHSGQPSFRLESENGRLWNPLTDDGDALRLAVKLRLSVCFEERSSHEWSHIVWVEPCFEPLQGDNNAATRRAIVRAAAKIGEQN